ncbi:MAG: glycosyltransferase family 1 protein [Anaerolineae bacterium]|nr:glycosyltransferase family 1 protein [Anaerolineae bacterium]
MSIPPNIDVVLSFAPYGKFLQIPRQLSKRRNGNKPIFVHWNTEEIPDLRLPPAVMNTIADVRSWSGRLADAESPFIQALNRCPPLSWIDKRMNRFRYVGDYRYAAQQGWIDVYADISEVRASFYRQNGLQALFVPWGSVPDWHDNLRLERDIDVLWFGKRRNRRRSHLLDKIRDQLLAHGVKMHVIDGIEHPFVYDQERTHLLNRAKITLNLLTQWSDATLPFRFSLAAANQSLVVSEPVLDHNPLCQPGQHYVSAPVTSLVDTILFYLKNNAERARIVQNAYHLSTTDLTLTRSLQTLLNTVHATRPVKQHTLEIV